jgi:hypothetical protein
VSGDLPNIGGDRLGGRRVAVLSTMVRFGRGPALRRSFRDRTVCLHRCACVITATPGFIRTHMTQDMKLPAQYDRRSCAVARRIYQPIARSRVEDIYVPRIWRPIMTILRAALERVFKHLGVLNVCHLERRLGRE